MPRFLLLITISFTCKVALGQTERLKIVGTFTAEDSVTVVRAFHNAKRSVDSLYSLTKKMFETEDSDLWVENWQENEHFMDWMGKPEKMKSVHRRIKRIHSKFRKKVKLVVMNEDRTRCKGWISAWTLPYGKVKIRLCDDFLKYRTHLQEKTLVHEMGHEIGLLFHRRIHGCWSAERAAISSSKVAKKSPENYAWLAVSLIEVSCGHPRH